MSDQQTLIDWNLEALRNHLQRAGLMDADVRLLCYFFSVLPRTGRESYGRKTTRDIELGAGVKKTTVLRSLRRLADCGLIVSESTRGGNRGGTWVMIDWNRINELPAEEAPEDAAAERLREAWSALGPPLVRPWSALGPRRACVLHVERSKAHEHVTSTCEHMPAPEDESDPARPWAREGGVTDADLATAVADRDQAVLVGLYHAAVRAGWWGDCDANRHRFLATAHHAVANATKSAKALLVHLCRIRSTEPGLLGWTKWSAASDDWASETRRTWRRDPIHEERLCRRETVSAAEVE